MEHLPKFKPERPIYLNEEVTGFKTKDQVLAAIETLRGLHWLCAYAEKARPFHMSFNDFRQFEEFKKTCNELGIVLKHKMITADELDELEAKDSAEDKLMTANSTVEDPDGHIHIED